MNRRWVIRRAGWVASGALGGAALAACGAGKEASPAASTERASLRVLTRLPYEQETWDLISQRDDKANVQMVVEPGPNTTAPYGQKVIALAAASSLPDLMFVHPNYFSSVVSKSMLADHEKLAAQAKFDLKGIQKEMVDSDRWTDGKLYAIPFSGVSYLLIVNAGLFKQRGQTLPSVLEKQGKWDWDGFRTTLLQLTQRVPGMPPIVGMPEHARGTQYLSQWIFENGGEVWSKDMKTCLLDSPKSQAALEYVAGLHARDRVTIQPDEASQFNTTSLQGGFESGRVGVYFRATTQINDVKAMADQGAELALAPVPKGAAGRFPRGAANSWGVTTATRHPEAAFRALAAWDHDPALSDLLSKRNIFPSRVAQFDLPAFKAALLPWEDLEVERAALRDVRIMATPDRFSEIDDQWNKAWLDALYGKKTVAQLLGEFVPQANALLRS